MCKAPHQWKTGNRVSNYAFSWSRPRCRWLLRTPPWHCDASAGASPSITRTWSATGFCRSGFTRERAGPAGQSPPAAHRCRRHRIRG
ncbi:hypothetical protein F7661_21815 [Pseudomonas sp. CFA]|nr:hypothetical protein F7661_21815 [Pseudomonas sp. CFA]